MTSKIKVAVFNNEINISKEPILGRPFSFNLDKIDLCNKYNEADYIFCNLHYLNCNEDYEIVKQSELFKKYSDKFVFWSMHDNPSFAYQETKSKKFICQPLYGHEINKKFNVVPVPLQMRHYEWNLIQDNLFIENCRNNEKIYNFNYVGQIIYANRQWLKTISLPKYDFEETKPIWHINTVDGRVGIVKQFCDRLSKSQFCFAPRGIGSSSFRLYQSLMVGTIPIIFGMNDYPFKDEVDWSEFSIENCNDYIQLLKSEEKIASLRKNGIEFWEKYVNIYNCDRIIFDRYLSGNQKT